MISLYQIRIHLVHTACQGSTIDTVQGTIHHVQVSHDQEHQEAIYSSLNRKQHYARYCS